MSLVEPGVCAKEEGEGMSNRNQQPNLVDELEGICNKWIAFHSRHLDDLKALKEQIELYRTNALEGGVASILPPLSENELQGIVPLLSIVFDPPPSQSYPFPPFVPPSSLFIML